MRLMGGCWIQTSRFQERYRAVRFHMRLSIPPSHPSAACAAVESPHGADCFIHLFVCVGAFQPYGGRKRFAAQNLTASMKKPPRC